MNTELLKQCEAKAQSWLAGNYNEETKEAVRRMLDNEDKTELIDAFYQNLEFGTGGLRGIMGAGSNRMNIYTVGAATQGLANYLKKQFPDKNPIKVVIGHDCRNNSPYFAKTVANIFSANGIKVYLFDALRPTPEISFAIRHLGCQSGVMITASHNPKEYNGYKVYWSDGAQVVPPHDKGIIDEVLKLDKSDEVKRKGDQGNIVKIGRELDEVYLSTLLANPLCTTRIAQETEISVVYTPIHGTGGTLVPQLLTRAGFKNVHVVSKQREADGNFSTVSSPNPEDPSAMSMAVALAEENNATLVLGTDPDADRVGMYARNAQGEQERFDGNQIATLLAYYVLEREKELGLSRGKRFMVRTIVTTPLLDALAAAF